MLIEWIRPVLLLALFMPLAVVNYRKRIVPNAMLGPMFVIGVVVALVPMYLTGAPLELSGLVWRAIVGVGCVTLYICKVIPAGVAKLLMALLPWFLPGEYLVVFSAGMVMAGACGLVTRKDAPIAPPMMIASLAVVLAPLLGR